MARIKLNDLENYLWESANFLRGHIDAGDYKQYIFPLLFLKRLSDVWDEEYEESIELYGQDFREEHRFIIPEGCHWEDIRGTTTNIGTKILTSMRTIEDSNRESLFGIFGDASWTNKDRLPDEMLIDLIEHFSKQKLNTESVPDDELGTAYEFLIKKFADDSGHTAQEFYSNRTVVKLMARILNAAPGDSVYDPTCGTGGMLLTTATHLKESGKEYRNLKLFGQEINLITSSIARMNMFMHGIVDFEILRGNTLENPGFVENEQIKKFDVILANPPYSIKKWNRERWSVDPYGRCIWGIPPQGCADYAFIQHIAASLNDNGRAAILLPHGVLFRKNEVELRKEMAKSGVLECVLGLGPNLFYNSPMEACVLFFNKNKKYERENKILFINAVNQVKKETGISFLEEEHITKIVDAFNYDQNIENFSYWASIDEVESKEWNLSLPFYVRPIGLNFVPDDKDLETKIAFFKNSLIESQKNHESINQALKEYGLDDN